MKNDGKRLASDCTNQLCSYRQPENLDCNLFYVARQRLRPRMIYRTPTTCNTFALLPTQLVRVGGRM